MLNSRVFRIGIEKGYVQSPGNVSKKPRFLLFFGWRLFGCVVRTFNETLCRRNAAGSLGFGFCVGDIVSLCCALFRRGFCFLFVKSQAMLC